jgi:trk system potassium uptake protein TrkH
MSFADRRLVRDYYVQSVEYEPSRIVRNVVGVTAAVELAGAIVLSIGFRNAGVRRPVFTAIFHSISAFCNAGFSTFSDSLEQYSDAYLVIVPIMILIVTGGIGFVVLQDLAKSVARRRHVVSVHAKVVLVGTAALILSGSGVFLLLESGTGALGARPALNAIFQSVTPRTAGFNTVSQSDLRLGSKLVTMLLMFIGGGPGSIAGGVKITPIFLLLAVVLVGADEHGEVRIFRRRMPESLVARAQLFILKAIMILVLAVLALSLTETLIAEHPKSFLDIAFEALSAFATVGLSTGITSDLTGMGKVVIIMTMFAGRVGLISLALPSPGKFRRKGIDYPTGEVLLG